MGYLILPSNIVESLPKLDKSEILVAVSLAHYMSLSGCFPSYKTIGSFVGLVQTKTVKRAIISLSERGLIRRKSRGQGRSFSYHFTDKYYTIKPGVLKQGGLNDRGGSTGGVETPQGGMLNRGGPPPFNTPRNYKDNLSNYPTQEGGEFEFWFSRFPRQLKRVGLGKPDFFEKCLLKSGKPIDDFMAAVLKVADMPPDKVTAPPGLICTIARQGVNGKYASVVAASINPPERARVDESGPLETTPSPCPEKQKEMSKKRKKMVKKLGGGGIE